MAGLAIIRHSESSVTAKLDDRLVKIAVATTLKSLVEEIGDE